MFAAVFAVIFMLVWTYLSITSPAEAAEPEHAPQIAFEKSKIEIITANARHCFTAELALNPAQHALGLMFRKELPPDHAMLFDFANPRPGSMWMKNTLISLDMLFVDAGRKIIFVAENTTPLSEEVITSPGPIRYVIELAAGTAGRLGIRAGDRFVIADKK